MSAWLVARGNKVFNPEHLMAEFLINQCAIGKGKELTVRMHFTNPDQIFFADQWLASCVDIHVSAQLLALTDDRIDGFQAQVQLICRTPPPSTRCNAYYRLT